MARFRPDSEFRHARPEFTAVVLINLGTPDEPTREAVRRYLKEFLSDPRVVELPRALWWLILNGIILNTRPAASAEKYASIWSENGSPLRVHTAALTEAVRDQLQPDNGADIRVVHAMRYGAPSIAQTLERLRADGCNRMLIVPLYPQYASSTSASVFDEVGRVLRQWRNQPEMRFVRAFAADSGYLDALASSIRDYWNIHGPADRLVMSFHGLPRKALLAGDPYHCECHKTARLLASRLGLTSERYQVTFQSRLGRARWLEPYTQPTIEQLARDGIRSVDVVCPGFVADCIETLEEIDIECRAAFIKAGGERFGYIPCLNSRTDWVEGFAALLRSHLGDWRSIAAPDAAQRDLRMSRAMKMGAER